MRDVMEFGEDVPRRPMLANMMSRLGGGTPRGDRRIIFGVGGIGGVLVLISMLQVWQVTTLRAGDSDRQEVSTGFAGLGAWGTGYVMGAFGLAAITTIVLFGPPQVRKLGRLAGLGWAGAVAGLLVAAFVDLGRTSAVLGYSVFAMPDPPEYDVAYGPGPFLAVLGIGATAVALYLTERPRPGQEFLDEPVEEDEEVVPPPRPQSVYQQPVVTGPVDLTVSPATPFMHLPESYHDR
ncbi:MAG TPA: hypothetical protein VFC00_37360 [Micromonosporaceae bacterium]|nr:hypothetical protein [Micromonosporaceae bacterium]